MATINPDSPMITSRFSVEGMTCAGCATRIEKGVSSKIGVNLVAVSLLTHTADVEHNEILFPVDKILEVISTLGFKCKTLSGGLTSKIAVALKATNRKMDLPRLLQEATKIHGVNDFEILESSSRFECRVLISYEPSLTGSRIILASFSSMGWAWELSDLSAGSLGDEVKRKFQIRFWTSAILTLPIFVLHFIFPSFTALKEWNETEVAPGLPNVVLISALLSTPVQLWVAQPLYIAAYKALRYSGRANMDFLITLSTTTAYLFSLVTLFGRLADPQWKGGQSFFETR